MNALSGLSTLVLAGLLGLPFTAAHAEYRAFELIIRNTNSGDERKVISTLDHIQYSGYHPVAQNEQVLYSDSWMCWGKTSHFKRICPPPEPDRGRSRPGPVTQQPN